MNWFSNILEELRWKATEVVWTIQDKIEMWKINKEDEPFFADLTEEIEVKPKKKKNKKKKK